MYYKKLKINGTEYLLAVNISGMGAPTDDTEASVGMFYMDENDGKVYKLTPDGWEDITVEIVQTTGSSEKVVMSQKAVTKELEDIRNSIENIGLDSVAWGNKTYRDIFATGNMVSDGDFENGLAFAKVNSGTPAITSEKYFTKNHSLKCFGTTSQQLLISLSSRLIAGNAYYIACKVKVDRYVAGNVGFSTDLFSTSQAKCNAVNDGFQTVSRIEQTLSTSNAFNIFLGTYSSANADAYIDDLMVVDLSAVFGDTIPTKEEMDSLYDKFLSIETYSDDRCKNAFAEEMNKKAAVIGMTNSNFVNASGVGTDNTTTARDMLKVLLEACNYTDILKIWNKKTKTISVGGENAREIDLVSSVQNEDFESTYRIVGGKTGTWYTDYSQYNLIIVAEHKTSHKMFAGVVLRATSSDDRFKCMRKMLDICNSKALDSNYVASVTTLVEANSCIACELPHYNTAMYQGCEPTILFEQNADVAYIPASTTKILALVTGFDFLKSIKGKATIKASDITIGSGAEHFDGDILTIEDIIYSMLLPSSNTCATAFSRIVGNIILNS